MQEIKAMEYVLSRTTISTPRVHRYFFADSDSTLFDQCGYIVMDYVEGNTVSDVWESLPSEQRAAVIEQVANIVSQLQELRFDQPGPLGGGRCRGYWFSDYEAGPFHDKTEFNDWFSRKLEFSQRVGRASKDLPPFDYSSFVMVHHDLGPHNLILDRNGKVWVIDWGNAGAYPAIFEAATLRAMWMCPTFTELLLPHIYNNLEERNHLMGASWAIQCAGYS